jgi:parvulin-like peptidyl-prolyl isomerase
VLRCRAWSEYGHCQSKLEQVLRDYAVMKGLQAGPDMDDERLAGAERDIGGDWSDEEGEATPGKKAAGKASAVVVPVDDGPKAGDAEKAAGEDDFGDFAGEKSTAQENRIGGATLGCQVGGKSDEMARGDRGC